VHNAFAKLGVTSRAQLTQLMRGTDLTDTSNTTSS